MHSHGALPTPLRDCLKRISGRSSRSERLLVLGCLSLGGVSGWNERTLYTHTARVDSLPLAPVSSAQDDHHRGVNGSDSAEGVDAGLKDAGGDAARKSGSTSGDQAGGRLDARVDCRSGVSVVEDGRGHRRDGGPRIDTVGDDQAEYPPAGVSATADTLPREMAMFEGQADLPTTPSVRSLHSHSEEYREFKQGRLDDGQGPESTSDFDDAALEQAAARPRDAISRRQPADFAPPYYQRVQEGLKRRLGQVVQSSRPQQDRIGVVNSRLDHIWFQTTLQKLKDASGDDPFSFLKRSEIISLPENYRAVFMDDAEEAVLEVMLRTGCHVQRLPVKKDSAVNLLDLGEDRGDADLYGKGFESLSLYGTAEENEAAFKLLHDLVQVVSSSSGSARSRMLEEYDVKRQVRSQSAKPNSTRLLETPLPTGEANHEVYLDDRDATINGMAAGGPGDGDDKTSPIPIRSVWTHRPPDLLPDEGPPEWTAVSFANRIAHLVAQCRLPRNIKSLNRKLPRATAVAQILACFNDPAAALSISPEAVDTALSFFSKCGDYKAVNGLLERLESIPSYVLQTRNVNILLQHSASKGHWLNYRRYLGQLLQRNLKPSWLTWATFHEVLCHHYASTTWSTEARRVMEKLGVLRNPLALQRVARNHLERFLELWIRNSEGKDIDDFLKQYDVTYATELLKPIDIRQMARSTRPWLSPGSVNLMVRILLNHGRTSDALKVVQALDTSARTVETAAVNTLLTAAYRARDAKFAVQLLQHFSPGLTRLQNPIRLDDASYHILFCLAWRKQCLNMLRVIWRYSCALGLVRDHARERIRMSLLGYWPPHGAREGPERAAVKAEQRTKGGRRRGGLAQAPEGKRSRRGEVFFAFAGKFVLGVREHRRKYMWKDSEVGYAIAGASGGEIAASHANDDREETIEPSNFATFSVHEVEDPSASDATTKSQKDVSTFMSQQDLLILCAQPRHTDPLGSRGQDAAHKSRTFHLLSLLNTDVYTQRRSAVPVADMLERAFELDMQWHKSGMGTSRQRLGNGKTLQEVMEEEGLSEEEKALAFGEGFAGVLLEGVQVPMLRPW